MEAKDQYGATPLHDAAGEGNFDIVKYLVRQGSDLEAKNNAGQTALRIVEYNEKNNIAKYLRTEAVIQVAEVECQRTNQREIENYKQKTAHIRKGVEERKQRKIQEIETKVREQGGEMIDLKNTKFHPRSIEESQRVQLLSFSLGYRWFDGKKQPQYLERYGLLFGGGTSFKFCEDKKAFEESEKREVSLEEMFTATERAKIKNPAEGKKKEAQTAVETKEPKAQEHAPLVSHRDTASSDAHHSNKCSKSFEPTPMDPISQEQADDVQRSVQHLLCGDISLFYPEVFISYATGHREGEGDAGGTGPGMLYAAEMIHALFKASFPCFSGLMVKAGQNWKIFLLKILDIKCSRAKVLLVLQTKAFYRSQACMTEVKAAIDRKCLIIPIRYECDLPKEEAQWPELTSEDDKIMRLDVVAKLSSLNSMPARGSFLDPLLKDKCLADIMVAIQNHLALAKTSST